MSDAPDTLIIPPEIRAQQLREAEAQSRGEPARPHYNLLRRYVNLRDAVQGDAAVRAEAEAELDAASRIHADRCVVTKEYAQALREALA